MTTRKELIADVLNNLLHGTAINCALCDLAGAPVNNDLPLCFGVGIDGVVETRDKLMGEERPVGFRQGQYFGGLLNGDAHTVKTVVS